MSLGAVRLGRMGRNAKQIAAELDQTRARLDSSLGALRRELTPWKLAKLGASRDWAGLGAKAQEALRFVREFMPGKR